MLRYRYRMFHYSIMRISYITISYFCTYFGRPINKKSADAFEASPLYITLKLI